MVNNNNCVEKKSFLLRIYLSRMQKKIKKLQ